MRSKTSRAYFAAALAALGVFALAGAGQAAVSIFDAINPPRQTEVRKCQTIDRYSARIIDLAGKKWTLIGRPCAGGLNTSRVFRCADSRHVIMETRPCPRPQPNPPPQVQVGSVRATVISYPRSIVTTGSTNIFFAQYRLEAQVENFVMESAALTINNPVFWRDIRGVILIYRDQNNNEGRAESIMDQNGQAIFRGLNIPVTGTSTIITVAAEINTVFNGAVSGDEIKIGFKKNQNQFAAAGALSDDFVFRGASSGVRVRGNSVAVDDSRLESKVVRKTEVRAANSVELANGARLVPSHSALIGAFVFSSTSTEGNNDSLLESVSMRLLGDAVAPNRGNGIASLSIFRGREELVTSTIISGLDNERTSATLTIPLQNHHLSNPATYYVYLDTADDDFINGALRLDLTNYNWNDGMVGNITPVADIPLTGRTLFLGL